MPRRRTPRQGTRQFWPRKRAARMHALIRYWTNSKDVKPLCFAGYKVGMTHVIATDNNPNTLTKGEDIMIPATIIECPSLKVLAIRVYSQDAYGKHPVTQIMHEKPDKEAGKTISLPKKTTQTFDKLQKENISDVTQLVHTTPKTTTIGKKKPEIFEIAIGGNVQEKLTYAQNILGKEIQPKDVFNEGQQVDAHSISKGKGYQGPVKRFGINIRSHKSEKTKRGPGNVGSWGGNRSSPVPHAGQTGLHQRTEYNKQILKISDDVKKVNVKGGFLRYGEIRNNYILLRGSVPGAVKRLIKLTTATRPNKNTPKEAPTITHISTTSKQ